MSKKIDPEVLRILQQCQVHDRSVTVPFIDGAPLPKALYQKVNKMLELLGGKWNRSAKAHLFPDDAGDLIDQALLTGEVTDHVKELQFYPTPPDLADHMVALATIKPDDQVLEPSCGDGALLAALFRGHPNLKGPAFGVELDSARWAETSHRLNGWPLEIRCGDFLTLPRPCRPDVVIMNPPFSKGRDIAHVRHAFEMLRPGGRLVALTSPGWTWREDAKHSAFRNDFESLIIHTERREGDFKSVGVSINPVLFVIRKPAKR